MSDRIIDNLERYYKGFIDQPDDYGFFYALFGYVNYILETPALKKITDEVMKKKQEEYDKLAGLEKKSLQELTQAKKKLLKIIKDNAIPPNSLTYHYFVLPLEGVDNILTELEIFEEGKKLNISGFKSDNFETFLYDIASNLLNLGHKSLLQEFLVSDEANKNYHYEPDSKFIIMSNKNGSFIFSKTLKLRREQSRFIEKTEKFELWGAFNAFLKFQKAFLEKSKNNDFEYISQKYCGAGRNWQESSDAVDIIFFAQDLDEIVAGKDNNQRRNSIHTLKKDNFKNYATIINAFIIKELSRDERLEALEALNETENKWFGKDIVPQKSLADIQKEVGESQKWQRQQDLEDKRHRETLKQNRILATKENKYIHAIDTIIERADLGNANFNIDYYYFNFEDRMDASKMLEKFLSELAGAGCFEKYVRTNYAGGVRFGFIKADPTKLREFKERLNKAGIVKEENNKGKEDIKKITIIELKSGKYLLAVNDDYKGVKKIRKSKYYPIFIEEVSKRDVLNRTDNKKVSDEMAEYFNNNKKCIIYMNGKYPLKTIFTGNEAEREISWEVKTEIIDEDAYLRKMKKVNKK